jgi:hypothetical protein
VPHITSTGWKRPFRLAGERIPPGARIAGPVDALVSMTTPRTDRTALPVTGALTGICRLAGTTCTRGESVRSSPSVARAEGAVPRPPRESCLEPEVLRDHQALHLVCALADLEDLLVAVEARDRRLLHEAVTAMDLERRIDHAM